MDIIGDLELCGSCPKTVLGLKINDTKRFLEHRTIICNWTFGDIQHRILTAHNPDKSCQIVNSFD